MQMVVNPLDRLREQRAQRLLVLLQDDLRAQMRQEDDDAGRRGRHDPPRTAQEKLQRKIAHLALRATRERVWNRIVVPMYQDTPINDLPKTREFWEQVDVTTWTKKQLDVACELIDLPVDGKKAELVARIQDWVHAPTIRAELEARELQEREHERVLASGRVFACGHNFQGQLGLGDRKERRFSTEIERLRGEHITHVVSGFDADFAFAIAEDGRVFGWGGGGKSLIDRGSEGGAKQPHHTEGKHFSFQGHQVGNQFVKRDGDQATCFLLPHLVPALTGKSVSSIACARSDGHIALTTLDDRCFLWGRGDHGELGIDVGDATAVALAAEMLPVPVNSFNTPGGVAKIRQVSVGNSHTAVVTDTGDLFTWGACWNGQLGLGVTKRKGIRDHRRQLFFPSPTPVEAFAKLRITKVSCGAVHTAAISSDGHLYTFGCGDGGRLGHGNDHADVLHPELVKALDRDQVLDVACSNWHSLCLVRVRGDTCKQGQGFVFAFGHGVYGQLGLGKQKMAAIPTRIPEFVHRKLRCTRIAAASYHSCALSADGKLFTWGQNASGCLGRQPLDGVVDATEPDVVDGLSGYGVGPIISIACGHRFTLVATGPWEPLESAPQFNHNEQLNRYGKGPTNPLPVIRRRVTSHRRPPD